MENNLTPADLDAIRQIIREEIRTAVPAVLTDADGVGRMLHESRASIYRRNDTGQLPAPVESTLRGVRWRVAEISAWIDADCPSRNVWNSMRGSMLARKSA